MKNGIAAVGIALLTLGSATATFAVNKVTERTVENKKVEIKPEELPEAIHEEIANSHAGAKISKAFKWVNDKNEITGYEVTLKTDKGEHTVKFKANGEPMK